MSREEELTKERKKELKQQGKKELQDKEQQEKQTSEKGSLWEEADKSELVKEAFHKIEFLSLTDEQKGDISIKIKEDLKIDVLYIVALILSLLIATLWLLQWSVAVVVGAMLIAPIMRPITGLAYTIARGEGETLKKSLFMLVISVVLSIIFAYLATKIIWFRSETSEIVSRTNPNLVDFFIAIFSGIIGVMSFKYEKLSGTIWWVAMAVALIPPLSVIGIELAFTNYSAAYGALLLFLTNILAIGLISTIFFWLYGFTPHNKDLQTKVFKRLMIFLFSLILILIPLSFSYLNLIHSSRISSEIQTQLEEILGKSTVSEVQVLNETDKKIKARVTIKILENQDEQHILQDIKHILKSKVDKNLHLEFTIIRILKV